MTSGQKETRKIHFYVIKILHDHLQLSSNNMGRTLHYEVINHNFIPTDKQQLNIYTLTERYCKEFEWTCETPDFDYYRCYPNWEYFDAKGLKGGQSAWEYINKSIRTKISS